MTQKDFFVDLREEAFQRGKRLAKRSDRFVLARTVSFLGAIFAFAAGWDGALSGKFFGILLLIVFFLLVHEHGQTKRRILQADSALAVVQDWLARFDDKWKEMPADGQAYLKDDMPQARDLNLLGHASMYQYLCQARTKLGQDKLAAALSPVPPATETILARQQAVRELMAHPRFLVEVGTLAALLPPGHDTQPLIDGLNAKVTEHPALRALSFLLPLALLVTAALAACGSLTWYIPGFVLLVQFVLAWSLENRTESILLPLASLHQELQLYTQIFRKLEQASMQAPLLRELQQKLRADAGHGSASNGIRALSRLMQGVEARRNLVGFILLNALFLWDFHCSHLFLRWRETARKSLADWLDAYAEFELLASLAVPGLTRGLHAFPVLLDDSAPHVSMKNAVPLLLPEDQAVPNDADFSAITCIITGSNMSGKTTYMRTLATNVILAYAGAPVCAESMELTRMKVYTSMRIADDLEHGISTFYAELLRIKSMIEASKENTPLLLCIDEIFRGTNSADRIIGAKAAIEHLTSPHCITLVTTHDFELCHLKAADGTPVENLHFEESYENDELHFDFKVKPGRCHTTNAKYLLKMAGILTE